jgi:hypothetical protein
MRRRRRCRPVATTWRFVLADVHLDRMVAARAVQTDERTPPAPDGARGHHAIQVNVG